MQPSQDEYLTHGFTKAQLIEWGYSWPPPEGWRPPSGSQLKQDLFVISELESKRDGFFVEFGACDGILFSNTHLLEKELGWNGILAEPARVFHEQLPLNRNCAVDFRCVWSKTGELLDFSEASAGEMSTIAGEFSKISDISANGHRKETCCYQVSTVSLNDLLSQHGAPKDIDYISIDTEGSEYNILSAFDFDAYSVSIFTIEHNWEETPSRKNVYNLMTSKGYKRKFESYSRWDDWYLKD